jgi:peptidoglycan hydrolase-like protein with peptidoglycan-binding domain
VAGVAVAAIVGAAVAAAGGFGGADPSDPAPTRTAPAATAPVTRQTLVESVTLAGELGYGNPAVLTSVATGTLTWLPPAGSTVRRGEVLFRVDEKPVVLLHGAVPMYRALIEGVKGVDVRQLERNLVDLGYGTLTVDETSTAATSAAVKRWQRALDLPESGIVERDRVIFVTGSVRVARGLVKLGAPATGDLFSYTGDSKVVTVTSGAGEIGWAERGAKVTVVLPGGASVAGVVAGVGQEATAGGETGPPDPASPGTGGARVAVTVTVADQRALDALDKSPVDVRYVARRRENVLTVPVGALLALAEGGYGVELVDDRGGRIIAVKAGLFADGRVEIDGEGITEGATVGIPQ